MESANAMYMFAAVVDAGSFAAAARTLGVPTSTVSRRINRLEERLGALLLQRSTRRVTPTPTGQAYYARCKQIVEDIAEAEAAVASMQSQPRGRLRVTGPPDGGFGVMATLVANFQERYPEVEVEVEIGTRYVDLIAEGFDVALRAGTLPDSSLIARRLRSSRSGAVASASYLERHGHPDTLDDLRAHRCLVGGGNYGRSRWPLLAGGWVTVPSWLRSNDFMLLRRAVLSGHGIGCLPLSFVGPELRTGEVQQVLPESVGQTGGVYVVYPSSRHLSAKVRAFVDFAVEHAADLEGLEGLEGLEP